MTGGWEMGVGAVGIGLTRGFFSQYTTKNIFVAKKNRSRVLPHPGDGPGEQGMAE
jgi:hypothetical protein